MSERYMTPEQLQKENDKVRGCMAVLCIMMLVAMTGGIVWVIKDICKNNKAHPNVISYINQADKKIIIYDVNTKQERLIDYREYEDHDLWFKNSMQVVKNGDTVMFVSPKYDKKLIFKLDTKSNRTNRLFFNKDSINTRINSKILKQQQDSILRMKQR